MGPFEEVALKRQLLVLLLLFSAVSVGQAAGLSGTVKSAARVPLEDVKVLCGRSLRKGFAFPERDGTFSFAEPCPVIYFQRDGYSPQAKIVEPFVNKLEIVLQDATATMWVVPSCPATVTAKSPGVSLRLSPPTNALVEKGYDVDYGYFSIGYGPEGKRTWLRGFGDGGLATLGVPPEDWLLSARAFSLRPYRSGSFEGMDIRGQAADGTYWRYLGIVLNQDLSYSGASSEAAAYFDRLIDGACAHQ